MVVDDAMERRVETSDDGVVVGESESGEDGDEAGNSLGAIGDEALDVGQMGFELVAVAEAVRGDEYDGGAGKVGKAAGEDGGHGGAGW